MVGQLVALTSQRARMLLALALPLVFFLALPVTPGHATKQYNRFTLKPGRQLTSTTGQFKLRLQDDGNLVWLQQANRPLWNAGTQRHSRARAVFQKDGNLVVYPRPNASRALWSSHTANKGDYISLQDDGNLVIYKRVPGPDKAIWNTKTVYSKLLPPDYLSPGHEMWSPNRVYHLVMQHDGNFVLYNHPAARAIWYTNTSGYGGARAVMQSDGNLVVYHGYTPLWNSGTAGQHGAYLSLQSDGNLVLYRGGAAVWASNTVGH